MKRILIWGLFFAATFGCAKKEEPAGVVLYGFMSMDEMPFPNVVILKQDSGYIKFRNPNGSVIEHSGRYTVFRAK